MGTAGFISSTILVPLICSYGRMFPKSPIQPLNPKTLNPKPYVLLFHESHLDVRPVASIVTPVERQAEMRFQGFGSLEFRVQGSGLVISGVISPLSRVISIVRGLLTPLITTHEPPSRVRGSGL